MRAVTSATSQGHPDYLLASIYRAVCWQDLASVTGEREEEASRRETGRDDGGERERNLAGEGPNGRT